MSETPTPTRRPRQIAMTPGVTTFVTSSTDGGVVTTTRARRRRRNRLLARQRRSGSPGAVLPAWFVALKTALRKRDTDRLITILAQSGSDLLRQEINGKKILDIMATNGDFIVAKRLLERGILPKREVVKMIKKYLTIDITKDKLKPLFELFDDIGEETYHILNQKLPNLISELVKKFQMEEFAREVVLETPLKDSLQAINLLIETRIRDIEISVRRRMLENLAPVLDTEFEMEDWADYEYEIEKLKSLLHINYSIGKLYTLEEFALIDFDNKSNRFLQIKDPAEDAVANCSFLGNKGDREGPVKIRVKTTNPDIPVEYFKMDDRTKNRYRLSYKGPKIDDGTEVIVTYNKNMSNLLQKSVTFNNENDVINVILDKNVTPIEFTVMPKPEWATEDGKILHVFCGKDMQKYLKGNNKSPFDRREIIGVQFLTTKEIKEQQTLLTLLMRRNTNLLKTPPMEARTSPKAPPPLDPVNVLQKRLNKKFNIQDSVLLQRIKNMRNLLNNPKLSKENEVLYKQKLKEYESQISDPQDALIKRKEKEFDNLLIQQMEILGKIQQYQQGILSWTDSQANYYQDLLNSFPRMIERLSNEIENMKNSRDGASKLKKPRLKKFKF